MVGPQSSRRPWSSVTIGWVRYSPARTDVEPVVIPPEARCRTSDQASRLSAMTMMSAESELPAYALSEVVSTSSVTVIVAPDATET